MKIHLLPQASKSSGRRSRGRLITTKIGQNRLCLDGALGAQKEVFLCFQTNALRGLHLQLIRVNLGLAGLPGAQSGRTVPFQKLALAALSSKATERMHHAITAHASVGALYT